MALDIIDVKLTKKQEKEILKAARAHGRIMLSLDGDKVTLSEDIKSAGTDIEFSSEYYEGVFRFLAQRGIVPSEELMGEVERIILEEKVFEDGEYFKAVTKLDEAKLQVANKLKQKIKLDMSSDISPKLKNDYRAVLKRLESQDYKADYAEKWAARILGDEAVKAYAKKLDTSRDKFGDSVLINRMYARLFLYEKDVQPGKSLRWIRLLKP